MGQKEKTQDAEENKMQTCLTRPGETQNPPLTTTESTRES